jgi:hypothetical protein
MVEVLNPKFNKNALRALVIVEVVELSEKLELIATAL